MAMDMLRLVKELNRIAADLISSAPPSSSSSPSLTWKAIREDALISTGFNERLVSVMLSCRQYKRIDFDSAILTNDAQFDNVAVTILAESGWINPLKSQQAQEKQQARAVSFEEANRQRVEAEKLKMERLRAMQKNARGGGTRRVSSKPGEPEIIEEVEEVEEIEYVEDDEVAGDAPPREDDDGWEAPPPPPPAALADDDLPPPPLPDDWDAPPPPPPPADDWDAPPPPPPAADDDWDAPPPPPPES